MPETNTYVKSNMKNPVTIREMLAEDWEWVRKIYLEGIATGQATFETVAPDWEAWDTTHCAFARLVAIAPNNQVVGWTALSPVSRRPVYSGVAEVSIYVATAWRGRGIGSQLLSSLIKESERHGIWTLQASVFPENSATIKLHESCGFRIVGYREKVGRAEDGRWRDTLLLERRSQTVGCQ